jgi:hypothetical protein
VISGVPAAGAPHPLGAPRLRLHQTLPPRPPPAPRRPPPARRRPPPARPRHVANPPGALVAQPPDQQSGGRALHDRPLHATYLGGAPGRRGLGRGRAPAPGERAPGECARGNPAGARASKPARASARGNPAGDRAGDRARATAPATARTQARASKRQHRSPPGDVPDGLRGTASDGAGGQPTFTAAPVATDSAAASARTSAARPSANPTAGARSWVIASMNSAISFLNAGM